MTQMRIIATSKFNLFLDVNVLDIHHIDQTFYIKLKLKVKPNLGPVHNIGRQIVICLQQAGEGWSTGKFGND